MKQASCALIIKDGLVLASHRRDNPNSWGLIGGKIDAGETPLQAMIRETIEETGFTADFEYLDLRFDGDYHVHVFIGNNPIKSFEDDEGMWKWVGPDEICKGDFADFNLKLLTDLGLV